MREVPNGVVLHPPVPRPGQTLLARITKGSQDKDCLLVPALTRFRPLLG